MKTKIKLEEIKDLKQDKRETLKQFSKVSDTDPEVIIKGTEILKSDRLAELDQNDIDNDAEIARRQACKEADALERKALTGK